MGQRAEHGWPVFWFEDTDCDRQRCRSRLEESHLRDGARCPHENLPEPSKKRGMGADEPPVVSVSVECWVEGRMPESIDDRKVEHRQTQDRKHDSGYDETFSRARTRGPASIGVHLHHGAVHRSTATLETDSPHVYCEFRHPNQLLAQGELAWGSFGVSREICPLESVGKLGREKHDMDACGQEYAIGASEDVIFPGALERIFCVAVEEEREKTGERHGPWQSTCGRIVNEEERDLDESVECKRKPLHSGQSKEPRSTVGGCVWGGNLVEFNR